MENTKDILTERERERERERARRTCSSIRVL